MVEEVVAERPVEAARVPLVTKVSYAVGYTGVSLITQVTMMWALYYYAPPAGRGTTYVPIHLLGIAFAVARIVDSVDDLIIGIISDRTRSRFGRRKPFIVAGALPLAAVFALLWAPPVAGESVVNFIYLTVCLILFFILYSVVIGPYLALLPEIAPPGKERITLTTWQALFNVTGLAIAMLGSSFLIERVGFRWMGLIMAVLALIFFLIPGLTVRERPVDESEKRPAFFEAFKIVVRNRPFRTYVLSQLFIWFGFNMIVVSVAYIATIIIGLKQGQVGMVLAGALIVSAACFKPVGALAVRIGKKRTMIGSSLVLVLVMALIPAVAQVPIPIDRTVLGVIVISLVGMPAAALFILPNALIADIADHGAGFSGCHLEGAYYGVQGFLNKVAMGVSSLAVGYLFALFGYSASKPLGILMVGPVAAVFVALGVAVFSRYELD